MSDEDDDSDLKAAQILKEIHRKIDFIYTCVVTAVGGCAVWFIIKMWEKVFS